MNGKSEFGSLAGGGRNGEYMLAWVEKGGSTGVDDVVRDFDEPADKVGFDASRVESEEMVGGEDMVKAKLFTNAFPKIPEREAYKARLWVMRAACWTDHIIDAEERIDESNGYASQSSGVGE